MKAALPLLLPDAEKAVLNNYVRSQENQVLDGSYHLGRPMSSAEVLVHILEHRPTQVSNSATLRDFETTYKQPIKPKSADVFHILQQVRVDSDTYSDVLGRARFASSHERLHFVLATMRLSLIHI